MPKSPSMRRRLAQTALLSLVLLVALGVDTTNEVGGPRGPVCFAGTGPVYVTTADLAGWARVTRYQLIGTGSLPAEITFGVHTYNGWSQFELPANINQAVEAQLKTILEISRAGATAKRDTVFYINGASKTYLMLQGS